MAINIYGLGDANCSTSDPIKDPKLYHRYRFDRDATGTVVAKTWYFGPILKTGTILSFGGCITETIATGGDRTVTLDLLKSTGGGAFASVLSAALVLNSSSTLYVPTYATLTTTAIAANDTLKITVAVAGSASNQALGLSVGCLLVEQP